MLDSQIHSADERCARLDQFGAAIDALRSRAQAEVGAKDVRHVRRLRFASRAFEVAGRALVHFSPEPVSFCSGVLFLWLHKQLEATEIGHSVLHGAYDGLAGADAFRSKTFHWQTPIDEEAWRYGHNGRHHSATNVVGKDADIHFGPVRLTTQTPWKPHHRRQLPFALFVMFPNFGMLMNWHFTGLNDIYFGNGRDDALDFLPDRSTTSRKLAWRRALRKWLPYYGKEYVLFPLLAGPMFWKVLLGNWLAEVIRDIYSAATIYCGHVGEDIAVYPLGSKAASRGEWYAMQIEASNNFEVSWPVSVLCGGLDRQIEHHLFPKLPPERLRALAPEVRALCQRYGIRYESAGWGTTLWRALCWIHELSRPTPAEREQANGRGFGPAPESV
jgi:linoleoyl-CoA desaturase